MPARTGVPATSNAEEAARAGNTAGWFTRTSERACLAHSVRAASLTRSPSTAAATGAAVWASGRTRPFPTAVERAEEAVHGGRGIIRAAGRASAVRPGA
ncbi:hypothetical protein [Streptomyces sp. NPDC005423]|uniref:hypothetical protein n=1 Tax=Streptomyces sp. NPDC005423 TaxID=3155343 RepID=UPI0033A107A7